MFCWRYSYFFHFQNAHILDFQKQWKRIPAKLRFPENKGGWNPISLYPTDDAIVEQDRQKHIVVLRRVLDCQGVQRYYKHFAVTVSDNDGI
jgi:hypothetical protein